MHEADKTLSVRFFLHPVENMKKTKEAGRPIFDDVEMVSIMAPGNTKTEFTAEAQSMHYDSNQQKQHTYAERFSEAYTAFKQDIEFEGEGTPITIAPFLTQAQKAEMVAMKIRTVEQLAGMADRVVGKQGHGFRQHVDAAKTYLSATTDASKLMREMEEMRRTIAELSGAPKVSEPETTEAPQTTGLDDEDLRNMLTDAGVDVDGRWGRKRLEEELAKLAKEAEAA